MYGFRKVYQLSLSFDDTPDKRTVWQFKHDCFKKDQPDLLCDIKRRTAKHNLEQYAVDQSSSSTSVIRPLPTADHPSIPILPLPPPPPPLQTQPHPTPHLLLQQLQEMPLNTEIHEQLFQLGNRLEVAEQKRKELHEETVKLREIQSDQQKVSIIEENSTFYRFINKFRQYVFLWIA